MLERRVLLKTGLVAAAGLMTIGLKANAIDPEPIAVIESPLFGIWHRQLPWLHVGLFDGRIGPRVVRYDYSDGVPFASVTEAEDYLLFAARDMHLDSIAAIGTPAIQCYHRDNLWQQRRTLAHLPFNIIRASNRIAFVSRRGFGNNVLMHPTMLETLQTISPTAVIPCPEPRHRIGRWQHAAMFNHINILTGTVLPPNEIVAFYRHSQPPIHVEDGPAGVIRDETYGLSIVTGLSKIFRFAIPLDAS